MAPEYAMNGIVSIKTDVFSYGVLLLEIVSSKKNNSRYHSEYPLNLIGYVSFPLNSSKFIHKILNIIVNIVYNWSCIRHGSYGMKGKVWS